MGSWRSRKQFRSGALEENVTAISRKPFSFFAETIFTQNIGMERDAVDDVGFAGVVPQGFHYPANHDVHDGVVKGIGEKEHAGIRRNGPVRGIRADGFNVVTFPGGALVGGDVFQCDLLQARKIFDPNDFLVGIAGSQEQNLAFAAADIDKGESFVRDPERIQNVSVSWLWKGRMPYMMLPVRTRNGTYVNHVGQSSLSADVQSWIGFQIFDWRGIGLTVARVKRALFPVEHPSQRTL